MMAAKERIPAYVREHGPLEIPVRVLNMANEIAMLKGEPGWEQGNRLAKTLAKEGSLALVLSVMRAGARAQEHRVEGPITVQCLQGTLRLERAGHPIELVAGEIVVLDAGVPHSHEALTDCAILLTVSQ